MDRKHSSFGKLIKSRMKSEGKQKVTASIFGVNGGKVNGQLASVPLTGAGTWPLTDD